MDIHFIGSFFRKKGTILIPVLLILLYTFIFSSTRTVYAFIEFSIPHLQTFPNESVIIPVDLISNEPEGFTSWNVTIEYDANVLIYEEFMGNTPLTQDYIWIIANELEPPGSVLIAGVIGYDLETGENVSTKGTGTLFSIKFNPISQYPVKLTSSDITMTFKDSTGNSLRFAVCQNGSIEVLPNLLLSNVLPPNGLSCRDVIISIYGQGFHSGAIPVIGTAQGIDTIVSDNIIKTKIPAYSLSPGFDYDITVTNPNGDFGILRDGFESLAASVIDSDKDGYTICEGDCNDSDPNINPMAKEICNDIDDNCNNETDEEGAQGCIIYFKDADGDTYGVNTSAICLCEPKGEYTATQGDDPDDNDFDIPVDTTPPNPPIVGGNTPTTSTRPTWTWNSGGNNGNGTFRYALDSNDMTSGAVITTATTFTSDSPLSIGSHTLYVQERDDAGNWSISGTMTINIKKASTGGTTGTTTSAYTGFSITSLFTGGAPTFGLSYPLTGGLFTGASFNPSAFGGSGFGGSGFINTGFGGSGSFGSGFGGIGFSGSSLGGTGLFSGTAFGPSSFFTGTLSAGASFNPSAFGGTGFGGSGFINTGFGSSGFFGAGSGFSGLSSGGTGLFSGTTFGPSYPF